MEFTQGAPFDSFGLSEATMRAIRNKGYEISTPVQAGCIPPMLEGKDVIAKAPTGTGKTMAFGIPIIERIDPESEEVQAVILAPTRELGQAVYEGLSAALPQEPLILKVSRIYRDARRLHGQGPYKDHLWFCVRTGDQDWTGRPTFYFEIAPDYYSYGMGFWAASAALMTRYRQQIDRDPRPLEKLVRAFNRQEVFQLNGPDYVRSKGQVSDLLRPWYQKKSLTLSHEVPLDESLYSRTSPPGSRRT